MAAACALLIGCQGTSDDGALDLEDGTPEPSAAPASSGPELSAPFDLGAVVQKVHFSYRNDGAGFSGGHSTYAVHVEAGRVTVTPYQPLPAPSSNHDKHSGARVPLGQGVPSTPDTVAEACPPEPEPEPEPEPPEPQCATPASLPGTPLELETVVIQDGATTLPTPVEQAVVTSEGELELLRGGITEHLRNTPDGVEQSWSFSERPQGNGDLTLHVRVSGLHYAGETDHGLHFTDPQTGLGLRYGLGTWIDAGGSSTEVRPQYANGEIVLTVPREVVKASTFPAVLDPVVGPELGLDAPIFAAAPLSQANPAVAFDGTNYLVVWDDLRNGSSDIYGTRVTKTGNVLDLGGIAISTAANNQTLPAVAFDGVNYLVVWEDDRNGLGIDFDIFGARVSTGGAASADFAISTAAALTTQLSPALAFDGTNYLVAWQDDAALGDFDIVGALVDTGTSGPFANFAITAVVGTNEQAPAVAFDGTNYLVVWEDDRAGVGVDFDIFGAQVSTGGSASADFAISAGLPATAQQAPAVAFDGTNYLVVWEDFSNGLDFDIFGRQVTTAATLVGLVDTQISDVLAANNQQAPAVAFDGTNYLVVWEDDRTVLGSFDIFGRLVSAAGAPVGAADIAISAVALSDQKAPALAFDGTNYLVAWQDGRTPASADDIFGARVSRSGTVFDAAGRLLSTEVTNDELNTSVAFDGTNYLVVWQDNRNLPPPLSQHFDIFGTRVSRTGLVLDLAAIGIAADLCNQAHPSVAFGGGVYLVAWENRDDPPALDTTFNIRGRRVSPAGAVLDGAALAISSAAAVSDQLLPKVAFGAGNFLVVWQDFRSGTNFDIFGRRVTPAGALLAELSISSALTDQVAPAVDFGFNSYLVVWEDNRRGAISAPDIFGARVSTLGALVDASGFIISAGGGVEASPAVAFDGLNHLVVWQDDRNGDYDIFGQRVSTAAALIGGAIAIETEIGSIDQTAPAIAFAGARYLAVWQDNASGNTDIRGRGVTPLGVPLGVSFAIADSSTNELAPALAGDTLAPNPFLVSYHRVVPSLGRVRARARLAAP